MARKTLAEVDRTFTEDDPQFRAAVGDDGMKKLGELEASSVESLQHRLFAFNPRMSYVTDEWMKADDFWKPTTTPSAAKRAGKPVTEAKKQNP
jgi:hypothetical protein